MAIPTKDVELVPAPSAAAPMVSTFERLASDPNVDVAKLEKLMELHERLLARQAEEQYGAAMSQAQIRMRPVAADAENPQTRSRYASYAQLDRALRPIYADHGFALSFDTGESPLADHVRILCYVMHSAGHTRTHHVDMPNDGKGAKGGDVMTKTHAQGAAMSYGMRYLLKMIFNVAVGEDDRDGNPVAPVPNEPPGFSDWADDLAAVAEEGTAKLQATWTASKPEYKRYLLKTNPRGWNTLKATAAKAGGDRA